MLKQKNFYSIFEALCFYKSYDPAAITTINISNSTGHWIVIKYLLALVQIVML